MATAGKAAARSLQWHSVAAAAAAEQQFGGTVEHLAMLQVPYCSKQLPNNGRLALPWMH
jgi:hypothetical protein